MRLCQSIVVVAIVAVGATQGACQGREVSYAGDIQPLFAQHCLQCHGQDADSRQADLQLDAEASARLRAIVPGDPDASPLLARVSSTDPELRMPPGELAPLSADQIARLRQWIAEGAKYEAHWAFQPISDPKPPLADEDLTDIDRFVVAKLRSRGLELSAPATKQQLLRRATFDLTGLPPTWDEVVAYVSDDSPRAFERVVDRLLASPAYGERWGRHWLDIARYADTEGGAAIGFKKFAFSYTYRDYVIKALNADLPYDRFVVEQLAADQLGLADNAPQLAALGFLTVGMQFRNPHDTLDDQIDVVTRGLLGLTVACARCHDHKFDAIPTADYYALYGVFASSEMPDPLPLVGEPAPSAAFDAYRAELQRLQVSYQDMAREQNEIMRARLRMQVGPYLREIAKGTPEVDLSTTNIFSYRTDDLRPPVVQRWRRYLAAMPEEDAVFGPWVKLLRLSEDQFESQCAALLAELKQENGEVPDGMQAVAATAPRWNPRVLEALTGKHPSSMLEVADAYGELFIQVHREWLAAQLEAALEALPGNAPVPDESPQHLVVNSPINRQLRRHLYGSQTPTNMDDEQAIHLLNRPIHDNVFGRKGAIDTLNLESPGSPPRAMVLHERPATGPFHVFRRGSPVDRGDPVPPRFLTALGGDGQQEFESPQRRLALARAIVDPHNPLTRRVLVNWVWQRHFGEGLVRTPDDFGTRGERPTHPALLDYLASRLLEDGWSLKSLHRRILLTDVYQQASVERPAAREIDPRNRWLWRMPRRRLEFEAMRDSMLAASGELQADAGGRPFDLLASPAIARRSIYAFVNRDIVAPLLSAFDGPNPNACTAKRPETSVPQQTLFALNSDFIQDRAQALAAAALDTTPRESNSAASDPADVVRILYHRAFAREPDEAELAAALHYLNEGEDSPVDVQRWQRLAHVLLAANEFVFVD